MNTELPETEFNPERALKFWFDKLSEDDKLTIENDIFNTAGSMALDTVLESNIPQDKARSIFAAFEAYLMTKKGGLVTKDALKAEAQRIYELAEKAALKE